MFATIAKHDVAKGFMKAVQPRINAGEDLEIEQYVDFQFARRLRGQPAVL